MPEDGAEPGFALEAEDLAQKLDDELLDIERAQEPQQRQASIIAALKTAHTLKGLASVVCQPAIARACHLLEEHLKQLQSEPATQRLNVLLEAGSALYTAAHAVREGHLADETLQPVVQRLENQDGSGGAEASGAALAHLQQSTPILAPPVRVTDEKLDILMRLSEELYYAAAVLRMRQDQLDSLCEDFASLMAKSGRAACNDAFESWNTLFNRLEDAKAGLERSARTLRKVSVGVEQQLGELRLISVGSAFHAFEHVVRDLGVALGKEVEFAIEDSGTALDRSIVESLREPLLHLIRNAVGHGLESPEERLSSGKPARGRLRIAARPMGSWAQIVVEDDGRGIDVAKVRRRAAQLNLPDPGDNAGCIALLFGGGISTAGVITELSGRGLGLANVRERIERMHGHIEAVSIPG
jgi:two-component system chemotaxis sensor kinase CheA